MRPQALQDGIEPDPRFTLANERTFLAWIRTGLALIAGAVAIEGFGVDLDETARGVVAVALTGLGVAVAVGAGIRWLRVEQAMRHGRPLPFPTLVPFLVLASVLVAAALLVLVLTR
ncbi:DUF202 domain-containing protein [Knoellia locipacati]|uniref:YidH family protein n=1 Tax=Knoellia locipacati TaxID=882824 RepID=UPI00384E9C72